MNTWKKTKLPKPACLRYPFLLTSLVCVMLFASLSLNTIHVAAQSPYSRALIQQTPTPQSPVKLSLRAGFEGNGKPYTFIPVMVRLENSGKSISGEIEVKLQDSSEVGPVRYPVTLPALARKEILVYFYTPNYGYQIQVTFFPADGSPKVSLVETLTIRSATDRLIGVAAPSPTVFNLLSLLDPPNGAASVVTLGLNDIPDFSPALDSIETLVISGQDSSQLSQSQVAALGEWIASGHRLLLTGGADWQKTISGLSGANWLPYLPGDVIRVPVSEVVSGLAALNESGSPFYSAAEDCLISIGNLAPSAEIIAQTSSRSSSSAALPLVTRLAYGNGEVFFFNFDPSQPALVNWPGMEAFYRSLIGDLLSTPSWANGFSDWWSAQNAAQSLPNVNIPPILLVCGFLFLYALILGPINYLVLRKLKRAELAWITTPALVLGFSLFILVGGGLARSRLPILNRMAVVQVWPRSPQARVDGLVGLYSPARSTYQLKLDQGWGIHTIPNYSSNSFTTLQEAGAFSIPDVQANAGSMVTLSTQGYIPAPSFSSEVVIKLENGVTQLVGEFTNQSQHVLKNATIITPDGAKRLGDIAPGQTQPIQVALQSTTITDPSEIDYFSKYGYSPPLSAPVYSDVFNELLGTSDYYADREIYRRYLLLSSAMNSSYGYIATHGGFYIAAWSEQPTIPARLGKKSFDTLDISLVIYRLEPEFNFVFETAELSSGLFTWSGKSSDGSAITPYWLYLYPSTSVELTYRLLFDINYSEAQSVVIHLTPQDATSKVSDINLFVWDFNATLKDGSQEGWVENKPTQWGNLTIENPNLIGPGGEVRLKLYSENNYISLQEITISLFVRK